MYEITEQNGVLIAKCHSKLFWRIGNFGNLSACFMRDENILLGAKKIQPVLQERLACDKPAYIILFTLKILN